MKKNVFFAGRSLASQNPAAVATYESEPDDARPPRSLAGRLGNIMSRGAGRGRGGPSARGGRGRGEPPFQRRPLPAENAASPALDHNADADGDADDEYLQLAASITQMMRDEVASREKLSRRVNELESALASARKEMDDLRSRNSDLQARLRNNAPS